MKYPRGFTLMEMLVTLIITALAVSLMFQALASFNHSQQRMAAVEGVRNNQAVMAGWVGDTIHGIVAVDPAALKVSQAGSPELGLTGDANGFTATTLAPLEGEPGTPTVIQWQIEQGSSGNMLIYTQTDGSPLSLPMGHSLKFVYIDHQGKLHQQWPPRQGLQKALPDVIELTYLRAGRLQTLAAAITAPLPINPGPYSLDDMQ